MRQLFILIAFLSIGSGKICAQQKEIFLKQIEFKLSKVSDKDYENEYFMTIKLNKGTIL